MVRLEQGRMYGQDYFHKAVIYATLLHRKIFLGMLFKWTVKLRWKTCGVQMDQVCERDFLKGGKIWL